MPTLEEYTSYFSKWQSRFNLSELATYISYDVSNLHKALNGVKDSKGYNVKIPKRCLLKLEQYCQELGIKLDS